MRLRGRFYFTPSTALLRRVGIYGIFLTLTVIAQTSAAFMPLFEGHNPNLTLVAVGAIGFFDDHRAGGISGIAAGALLDGLGSSALSLMPLFGFLVGYFCGRVAGKLLPRTIPAFAIPLGGIAAVNMLLTIILAVANGGARFWILISRILLPELLLTAVFGVPTALFAFFCVRLAGRTGRKKGVGKTYVK